MCQKVLTAHSGNGNIPSRNQLNKNKTTMKKQFTTTIFRTFSIVAIVAVFVAQTVLPLSVANAEQIDTRSLELRDGDNNALGQNGGSRPSGVVDHFFTFTLGNANQSIGSIQFQYCTTAADVGGATCVPPAGLDVSQAATVLSTTTGVTGLTINKAATNVFYLSRTPNPVVAPGANAIVTVLVKNIINPSTVGTFFVRISTFASFDATGSPIDSGTVAASTADPIELSGVMPESLVFCTGRTVNTNTNTNVAGSVPDCSTATDGVIGFNKLFSPTDTAYALSQMAASTNAGSGYAISVNGPTLTSAGNTINPMGILGGAGVAPVRGTAQFGMNLVANTAAISSGIEATNILYSDLRTQDPAVSPSAGMSANVFPAANAANYRGQPVNGYETQNLFKYVDGEVVAASTNGGAGATDAQIFTVSYIANVPGSQPAGTYSTTLTYICTPTF